MKTSGCHVAQLHEGIESQHAAGRENASEGDVRLERRSRLRKGCSLTAHVGAEFLSLELISAVPCRTARSVTMKWLMDQPGIAMDATKANLEAESVDSAQRMHRVPILECLETFPRIAGRRRHQRLLPALNFAPCWSMAHQQAPKEVSCGNNVAPCRELGRGLKGSVKFPRKTLPGLC